MTDTTHTALTTEALEALLAQVTPGEWGMQTVITSCGVCHKIGPWPHKWRGGSDMSACIYDDYPSQPEGTDNMVANARLIAIAPVLAREVIALRAELARVTDRCAVLDADGIAARKRVQELTTALAASQAGEDALDGLIQIVEGIDGAMNHGTWRDEKGMRLKDTPEWVAAYNSRRGK